MQGQVSERCRRLSQYLSDQEEERVKDKEKGCLPRILEQREIQSWKNVDGEWERKRNQLSTTEERGEKAELHRNVKKKET